MVDANPVIRLLGKKEKVPYALLLLADELCAIENYIHNTQILVLKLENKIVGVLALKVLNDSEIEIKNIAIDIDSQNQGFGSLILRGATDFAKTKNFEKIIVGTGDAAIKQLYFYQKNGFEVFDIKKRYFIDNYPQPIYENGIRLKHMIMLKKDL